MSTISVSYPLWAAGETSELLRLAIVLKLAACLAERNEDEIGELWLRGLEARDRTAGEVQGRIWRTDPTRRLTDAIDELRKKQRRENK